MTDFAGGLNLDMNAVGPVAAAYVKTRALVAAIMGPMGSGKTIGSCLRALQAAIWQAPSPRDGKRKLRIAIIRETYPQLMTTTMKSWNEVFPKEVGKFTSETPITHLFDVNFMGYPLQIEALFIAIGDKRVEDVVKGLEINAFYLNEADLSPRELFEGLLMRAAAGRFPSAMDGGPAAWAGGWLDFNAPDTENWTYERFVENCPADWKFFKQPSGLAPDAENIRHLAPGYYQQMMRDMPEWQSRRFVRNEFGYSREGRPVYGDDFNDALHVTAEPFGPVSQLPILLGIDQGLNPAIVMSQQLPDGRWITFDEIVGEGITAGILGEMFNERVGRKYQGAQFAPAIGDPAGFQRNAATKDNDPTQFMVEFSRAAKLQARAAPTNAISVRLSAVRNQLRRMVSGRPGYLLSPECRFLRKGFNSGYRFARLGRDGSRDRYAELPDKTTIYANPHDAQQYVILGHGGFAEVMKRDSARRQTHAALPRAGRDFNPYAPGASR